MQFISLGDDTRRENEKDGLKSEGELKITAIKPHVKSRGRYAIYLNERYAFSLGEAELVSAGLRLGQVISLERLAELQQRDISSRIFERALNFASLRPRSKQEIHQYIDRVLYRLEHPAARSDLKPTSRAMHTADVVKGFDAAAKDKLRQEIITRLTGLRYVDDENFAQAWVTSRGVAKPRSARVLRQELRAKGVNEQLVAAALSSHDEAESLQKTIIKKRRMTRYKDDDKLKSYLLRQGFSYEQVSQALKKTDTTFE